MTKTNKLLLIFSLSMILMGASKIVAYHFKYGLVNIVYAVYVFAGLSFCVMLYLKLKMANWLLFIFFLLQVVVIYNPGYRYDLTTGLAFKFTYWTSSIDIPVNERFGFAFNFLSIFLMGLSVAGLDRTKESKSPNNDKVNDNNLLLVILYRLIDKMNQQVSSLNK